MTPTKPVLLLAASGLALTLAGCKVDNRPLLARFSGQPPPAYAALPQPGLPPPGLPDIDASPGVYPAGYLPPAQAYPYAERAYAMDRVAYQAPPAYGFAYEDEQPWVWEAADDGLMFAEPYGEDYRFYYYEPGAAYPYFVRDDEYGYAYGPNGALLALFDAAGALIAADQYGRYYPEARGYWSRGYDLHRAYGSGRPYAVDPAIWAERAPRLRQVEQSWIEAPQRQPAWRDWRASRGERFAGADTQPRFAQPAPRFDNGRQPGFDRGQRRGFAGEGRQFAAAPTPGPQVEALRGRDGRGRGPEGRNVPGFVGQHGREAAARAPQVIAPRDQPRGGRNGGEAFGGRAPRFANAAPAGPQGGGWQGARGGHGGGGDRGQARAQVQAQVQAQPQWQGGHGGGGPGGGGHGGGGDHGGRGAPQGQPQAQPQPQGQGGGQGHGHGGGGGGNGRGEGHGH